MPFELLEPLDVGLEDVPPGAGPGGGDGVGGLDDHRLERWPVDVHVVGRHGHDHGLVFAVFSEEVDAELEVGSLHLAVDRLANVVQERGADGDVRIETDFPRHDAGEPRDLSRVGEHVLTVARPELQPSHEAEDLRMKVVQPQLEGDGRTFLSHGFFGFVLHLLHHFLDARRVNASVRDQPLDGLLGDLAAVGIEPRQDDRARRVVDDQVDTGR